MRIADKPLNDLAHYHDNASGKKESQCLTHVKVYGKSDTLWIYGRERDFETEKNPVYKDVIRV